MAEEAGDTSDPRFLRPMIVEMRVTNIPGREQEVLGIKRAIPRSTAFEHWPDGSPGLVFDMETAEALRQLKADIYGEEQTP